MVYAYVCAHVSMQVLMCCQAYMEVRGELGCQSSPFMETGLLFTVACAPRDPSMSISHVTVGTLGSQMLDSMSISHRTQFFILSRAASALPDEQSPPYFFFETESLTTSELTDSVRPAV